MAALNPLAITRFGLKRQPSGAVAANRGKGGASSEDHLHYSASLKYIYAYIIYTYEANKYKIELAGTFGSCPSSQHLDHLVILLRSGDLSNDSSINVGCSEFLDLTALAKEVV